MADGKIQLKITGMTCGHCVHAVTEALREVAGVKAAKVTLQPGMAEVEGETSGPDAEALIAAVADAGYQAQLLPRSEPL